MTFVPTPEEVSSVGPAYKRTLKQPKLYKVYIQMKQRCDPKNAERYQRYAGRGIRVCPLWLTGFHVFQQWALANGYKEGLYLDRQDNDGDYTPANCRWVDYITSSRNKSHITKEGRKYTPY